MLYSRSFTLIIEMRVSKEEVLFRVSTLPGKISSFTRTHQTITGGTERCIASLTTCTRYGVRSCHTYVYCTMTPVNRSPLQLVSMSCRSLELSSCRGQHVSACCSTFPPQNSHTMTPPAILPVCPRTRNVLRVVLLPDTTLRQTLDFAVVARFLLWLVAHTSFAPCR